jgi:hypothetical protein
LRPKEKTMSKQENASGAQVPCISLLAHLLGFYVGLAICAAWLPRAAIIGGAAFTTLNMVAFWWHIRSANAAGQGREAYPGRAGWRNE